MTANKYWIEKEESSVFRAKKNSAFAAVKILMSACEGDSSMARRYFEKWRKSDEAADPEMKQYVECFDKYLKSFEKPKKDLSNFSGDWWKK